MRRSSLVRIAGAVVIFNLLMALTAILLRRLMPSHGDEVSDEIALATAGNGIELRSRASAFRGGTAKAIMGGLQLDLRDATLAPEGAHLDVQAVMGGVEILLPESWPVRVTSAHALLGGVDHPRAITDASVAGGAELELSLMAVLGGIDVRAQAAEAALPAEPTARGD